MRTLTLLLAVALAACGSGNKCITGQSVSCTCNTGATGAQVCNADGTFGMCACGGVGGGSGGGAGGGSGGGAGGGSDGGTGGGSGGGTGGGSGGGTGGGGAGGGSGGGAGGGSGGGMAATSTTVTTSQASTVFGEPVTFTATVTSPTGTPSGTVTFSDGVTPIGSGTLAGGVGSLAIATLDAGSHAITATYPGDATFAASTSMPPVSQTVTPAATTATISRSPNNDTSFGQSVTFQATIVTTAPGSGTPAGQVDFFDDPGTGTAAPIASCQAETVTSGGPATGTASCAISTLTVAAHTITAQFVPQNSNFTGSTTASGQAHVVNIANTTTTVARSSSKIFTATVASAGAVAPTLTTGKVSFTLNNAPETCTGGGVQVAGNVATCTFNNAPQPGDVVGATFAGDPSFNTSSGTLTVP